MKIVDLTGKRFGKLLVIGLAGGSRSGSKLWNCQCDCGNVKIVTTRHLNRDPEKSSVIRSCGCVSETKFKDVDGKWFNGYGKIHGQFITRIKKSAKRRSKRKDDTIKVSIDAKYLNDLWEKQDGKCAYTGWGLSLPERSNQSGYTASIDRVDSSKGYIPGNVQFVHRRINVMKNNFDSDFFVNTCRVIAERCPIK